MKYQNCKFGDSCKYYHPKGLKNTSHIQEEHLDQKNIEEKNTYTNVVEKSFQPQTKQNDPFLGITQPPNQNLIGQAHQFQQPFLGQTNQTPQAFLDIQKNQKQMMELFMNLSQKVNSMCNMQMFA